MRFSRGIFASVSLVFGMTSGLGPARAQICDPPCPANHECRPGACVPICDPACAEGQRCVAPNLCRVTATEAADPASDAAPEGGAQAPLMRPMVVPEDTADACRNRTDDDGDGLTDCADSTCSMFVFCAPQPAPTTIVVAPSPTAAAAPRDRQADGGFTFAAGIEPMYTFVYYTHQAPGIGGEGGGGRGFTSTAHAFTLMGSFEIGGGFNEYVYLTFRFSGGGILSSDDSSGFAGMFVLGPSLTLRPVRPFFIAIDALAQIASYDDLAANVHDYPRAIDGSAWREIDGHLVVGPSFGLRLGFVIQVGEIFAITPELRFHCMPTISASDETDVFFTEVGAGTRTVDATGGIMATGGLFLGTRLFL